MRTLALIAHDEKKQEMLRFAKTNKEKLQKFHLLATATTGNLLRQEAGLKVECLLSGPLGGDQQVGARIAEGKVHGVLFFRDPLTVQPHEPDITALIRIGDVHLLPFATNPRSADLILQGLIEEEEK